MSGNTDSCLNSLWPSFIMTHTDLLTCTAAWCPLLFGELLVQLFFAHLPDEHLEQAANHQQCVVRLPDEQLTAGKEKNNNKRTVRECCKNHQVIWYFNKNWLHFFYIRVMMKNPTIKLYPIYGNFTKQWVKYLIQVKGTVIPCIDVTFNNLGVNSDWDVRKPTPCKTNASVFLKEQLFLLSAEPNTMILLIFHEIGASDFTFYR